MTYDAFVSRLKTVHRPVTLRRVWELLAPRYHDFDRGEVRWGWPRWRRLAVDLRLLVPDGEGWFDRGRGEWCWPWRWYRRYYERREAWRLP